MSLAESHAINTSIRSTVKQTSPSHFIALKIARWPVAVMATMCVAAINVQPVSAATINAASCSQTAVQSAINTASDGDTVNVPAGNCTWKSLTLNKAIALRGPACTMSGGTPNVPTSCPANITISGSTLTKSASGIMRIQNFAFKSGGESIVTGSWLNAHPILFMNNMFTVPGSALFRVDVPGGVIFSHNAFSGNRDNDFLKLKDADNTSNSWGYADTIGVRDSDSVLGLNTTFTGYRNIYIEDNTFYGGTNQGIDCDDNCRMVNRHNSFLNSESNSHGQDTSLFGMRHFEIYDNNFMNSGARTGDTSQIANENQAIWIRGATGVIFNNTFDNLAGPYWGTKDIVTMNIRSDGWNCPQAYPVSHQLGQNHNGTSSFTDPIYLWNNTWNAGQGTGDIRVSADYGWGNGCGQPFSTYFQWGRDGVNNGTTNTPKPGYTAYTYPHPLTTENIELNPTVIVGGESLTGTVTLAAPAPTGGALVTLSSSDPSTIVPPSVTVPAGLWSTTFAITTIPVNSPTQVTITETYNTTHAAMLTVIPLWALTITSVSLNPSAVTGGVPSTGMLTLNAPAPTGGVSVSLASDTTWAAIVPGSVSLAGGATIATFPVNTLAVTIPTPVTVSATYNTTLVATMTVMPPVLSTVSVNPKTVSGGVSSIGTVTLNGVAPTDGAAVSLTSSDPSTTVPAVVTVAAGATSATFTITTIPVSVSTSVTISGTYGVTKNATLTLTPLVLSTMSVSPATVTGGVSSTGTVTLNGVAPTGGAAVSLTNSDPSITVPAVVTVAAGATSATFTITTIPVSVSTPVTISGTFGVTKNATLTVVPPVLSTVSVSPATVTGGVSSTGTVTLSGLAPAGGTIVTLAVDKPAAAVPASVTVLPGAKTATFVVTTNPVATPTSVTITATLGTTTKTDTLKIRR